MAWYTLVEFERTALLQRKLRKLPFYLSFGGGVYAAKTDKEHADRNFAFLPKLNREICILLETWSSHSRPFVILPVSAVSDAQKLATGKF